MSWTCESVLEELGDRAQVTAGGIIMLQPYDTEENGVSYVKYRHVKVGYHEGFSFILTEEGRQILESRNVTIDAKPTAKPVKAPKAKKSPGIEDVDLDKMLQDIED